MTPPRFWPRGKRNRLSGGGWRSATLNPKTAAFFLAFVPQFVDPAEGSLALQFLVLGSISVTLNTLTDVLVAFAASGIREGAGARPALARRLREASGAAMIALGLGLALARRPAS